MVGYWVSFGLLAVAFFVGILYMRYLSIKTANIEITPQIKKHSYLTAFKLEKTSSSISLTADESIMIFSLTLILSILSILKFF